MLAIKIDQKGTHQSYAQVIPAANYIELKAFFDNHISKSACVRTDGWKGYLPLKEEYKNLIFENSGSKGEIIFPNAQADYDDKKLVERNSPSV